MSKFKPTIKLRNNEFDLLYDEGDKFKFSDMPRLLGGHKEVEDAVCAAWLGLGMEQEGPADDIPCVLSQ